ncbi:MAG: hypothetical protein NTW25_12605 [Candidatus Kapabacteria bacterium]|nr:hypothetical protein [Candidatus Kapabacteria bacterium]
MPQLISNSENIFNQNPKIKILILRQDRLGDLIISVPYIKELRKVMPEATIDILLSDKNYGAKLCIEDYVNTCFCYSKNLLKITSLIYNLKKEKYDLIIDLLDNESKTSTYLIQILAKNYSLGFNKENSNIYSHIVPLPDKNIVHIVERNLNLLLPFGVDPSLLSPKLEYKLLKENVQFALENLGVKTKFRIGLNLSGSNKSKYWGKQNNIELINLIRDNYQECEIILFAFGEYVKIAKEIKTETKFGVLSPKTKNINNFAAMLLTCDIIITPDTSVIHFASAFDIKCIGIFSKEKDAPAPWTPYKTKSINLITEKEISSIKPDTVFKAFQKIL